jgi:hypothetical protein
MHPNELKRARDQHISSVDDPNPWIGGVRKLGANNIYYSIYDW